MKTRSSFVSNSSSTSFYLRFKTDINDIEELKKKFKKYIVDVIKNNFDWEKIADTIVERGFELTEDTMKDLETEDLNKVIKDSYKGLLNLSWTIQSSEDPESVTFEDILAKEIFSLKEKPSFITNIETDNYD